MFNVIPFRAARNLMNTSMDDMLSDRFFRNFFDVSVEEELDETAYWLELIMELELVKPDLLQDLYLENKELLKIVVKSILTMRDKVNGKV